MGYYLKILEDTADAVNRCKERNIQLVDVRRVRKCNAVSSRDRSQIVFISRALEELSKEGFLKYVGRASPKKYKILKEVPIDALMENKLDD